MVLQWRKPLRLVRGIWPWTGVPVPVLWEHDSHPVGSLDGLYSMKGLSRFVPGVPLSFGGQRQQSTILVTFSKTMMFPQTGGPEAPLTSAQVN